MVEAIAIHFVHSVHSVRTLPVKGRERINVIVSSKELVKRAIEFRYPERVPYNFDSNRTPVIAEKYGDDFEWVFATQDPDFKPCVSDALRFENEFGVIYERLNTSHGEPKEYPLAYIARRAAYRLPDFSKPVRYLKMEEIVKTRGDKYIMGMFPHFLFQVMIDLYVFETLMLVPYDDREGLERLTDHLMESCL